MDFQWLFESGFARELIVFVIAALPVVELRGSLPVAINLFGLPWPTAVALSVAGNLLPVPFLILFLDWLYRTLRPVKILDRFFTWLFARTRRRGVLVEKYEFIGLMLFVAVPLPFTGAWTGSIMAFLLGLRFWPAFFSILGGVLIAAAIVTTLALLGWLGAVIAGILLSCVAVVSVFRDHIPVLRRLRYTESRRGCL